MRVFKNILDFYIHSSIHVALSVFSLIQITNFMFHIPDNKSISFFAFFGTIVGYNFVKYIGLVQAQKLQVGIRLKVIIFTTLISFSAVVFYFFQLQLLTQMLSVAFLAITLLYTLPFFPNRKNARNWAGVKIYIVALCWVGVTLVLPILDSNIALSSGFYLKCIQRFILVFVLILIFEIIDLAKDDPHLQTVPQQIGVKQTKILGYVLLIVFCVLELFKNNFKGGFQFFELIFEITIVIALLLVFAKEKRSKYYTSFWVESVPFFWWLMILWLNS